MSYNYTQIIGWQLILLMMDNNRFELYTTPKYLLVTFQIFVRDNTNSKNSILKTKSIIQIVLLLITNEWFFYLSAQPRSWKSVQRCK